MSIDFRVGDSITQRNSCDRKCAKYRNPIQSNMAEHSARTVVVEVKYVSSTNLVALTENCKLDIPLNCSVKELEKTLLRMCGVENFGTGILRENWVGNGISGKFWVGNGICNPPPPLQDPL